MSLLRRSYQSSFLLLTFFTAFGGAPLHGQFAESVKQIPGPSGHTVWQIDQPIVTKPNSDYPQIKFSPGETVTVAAAGCVQTGGSDSTWKRYVDPAGENSDVLYHGQISIPGAMDGLANFLPTQPTVYTIPANTSLPANRMHLQLGYTDDNFADNGYYARNGDNGNMDQCLGLGNARIILDIAPLQPAVQPPAETDYTLTIDSIMIRNPRTHHHSGSGKDTDVLGAGVIVNGTPAYVNTQTVGDLERGDHAVNFATVIRHVRPEDRLDLAYTVINAGHSTSEATATEVTDIISKGANLIPTYGSTLAALVTGLGDLIKISDADCDGPVAADAILATGSDLAAWTANGPYTRTRTFPGVDSALGCGTNSFYEVTYTIAPGNIGPQPYSVEVNARSLASKPGSKIRVLRQ